MATEGELMWTPGPSRDPLVDPTEPPEKTPNIEPEPGVGGPEPGIDHPGVERGKPGFKPDVEPVNPEEE